MISACVTHLLDVTVFHKSFLPASHQDRLHFSQDGDKWHHLVSAPVSVGVPPQGCCCMILWICGSRCIFATELAPLPFHTLDSFSLAASSALHPPDMVNLLSNTGSEVGNVPCATSNRPCSFCLFCK